MHQQPQRESLLGAAPVLDPSVGIASATGPLRGQFQRMERQTGIIASYTETGNHLSIEQSCFAANSLALFLFWQYFSAVPYSLYL